MPSIRPKYTDVNVNVPLVAGGRVDSTTGAAANRRNNKLRPT